MTQIKILVNNIHDVTHRAAAETELNVYLKTGWKVQATNQHMDADNGSLMLTTILTKEGDETAKTESKQETVKQSEDKNPSLKTEQQNTVKEAKEEKTKAGDEENKDAPTTTEETETKKEKLETPKGFKIKEKKDDPDSSESSKTSAAKTETKETKEGLSDEIEKFDPEEKTSEK